MSNLNDSCQENSDNICNNRRDFLVKASVTAGGLLLSLSGANSVANAKTVDNIADTPDDIVLKLDDKSPLSKIGGTDTINTKSGKVIVVRTGDMAFSAYSAVCPHKAVQSNMMPTRNSFFARGTIPDLIWMAKKSAVLLIRIWQNMPLRNRLW